MSLAFATVEEAFRYCRDMDASLSERLETFANASRALRPEMQEAIDRTVERLKAYNAGEAAPKPGEIMPPFTLPDETGRLVGLDTLLADVQRASDLLAFCRERLNSVGERLEEVLTDFE